MAFVRKTWKDRLVEFPGRRRLKNVATGEESVFDVSRNEGNVLQEGDAFDEENMNDLEGRIADEFDELNQPLYKQQGVSYTYSFGAGAFGTFYVPIPSISGYTPVALTGYDTNDYTVYFMAAQVQQNRIFVGFKNVNTSAGGTRTAYFIVLYLRN